MSMSAQLERDTILLDYATPDLEKSGGLPLTFTSPPSQVLRPDYDRSTPASGRNTPASDANDFDPNLDSDSAILGANSRTFNFMPPHRYPRCVEDDSPYPEVRSAVANFDDPTMPVSTLRAWTLGIVFAILLPALNQFFYMRYPSVVVGGVCALPACIEHSMMRPSSLRN
jgi:hypothetical protein